ncbi:amidohydrolase family protein [Rathayibacter sp. VKM Ac-2760]|uniref:amidohydrolase family protein n=1 Tax=Rathayibacter sp. VKM Ac-2760 TaxID=2609253 RepID=UPI001316B2E4|nr:amidohydrolase family protein [Rathayibacter sp. VKM Ac-2760]QHC61046.1 amidohydrolase family protein [Rathayibacter sp. VKM Ac-2760]
MIVDAHLHLWDPVRHCYDWLGPRHAPIDRVVTAEEALGVLRAEGVGRAVLVQAADTDEDTDAMLASAAAHPEIVGVVAFLPLEDPAATAHRLETLAGDPLVVGARVLVHDRADPDWLLRSAVRESLTLVEHAGLALDVPAVLPRHLAILPELVERHPELTIVVDHLGKPPLGALGAWRAGEWARSLRRLAPLGTIVAKLSGFQSARADPAEWSIDELRPVVDAALDVLGPDRLMFGGDWPVVELAGGYGRAIGAVRTLLEELNEPERAAVLAGTATRVYGLGASSADRDVAKPWTS